MRFCNETFKTQFVNYLYDTSIYIIRNRCRIYLILPAKYRERFEKNVDPDLNNKIKAT